MNDHQQITAERGRRAADLRAAAVALLEQQSIAAGVMLDLDSDQVVAAGPKAAILYLLSKGAPAATSGDALGLQQLKALALAATPGIWEAQRHGVIVAGPMREYANGSARSQIATFNVTFHDDDAEDEPDRKQANAAFCAAARPEVVLGLIARIEHAHEVAASWQRTAEKKDRDWNEARMAFENYKCAQRAESIESAAVSAATKPTACALPPTGWTCTRAPGHEGPCAAVPTEVCADDYTPEQFAIYQHGVEDGKLIAGGMERYKVGVAARDAATKPAAAPAVREGWAVAPIIPTPEMLAAGREHAGEQSNVSAHLCWTYMIAAAPDASTPAAPQAPQEWIVRKEIDPHYGEAFSVHGPDGSVVVVRAAVPDPTETVLYRYLAASTTGAAQTAEQVPQKTQQQEKCWSRDEENFSYQSLEDLLDTHDELKPGDTVWVADAVRPNMNRLIDADDVTQTMGERAYDIAGEHAEDYPDVSKEAEDELNALLAGWVSKNCAPTFWGVENVRAYVLSALDFPTPTHSSEAGDVE